MGQNNQYSLEVYTKDSWELNLVTPKDVAAYREAKRKLLSDPDSKVRITEWQNGRVFNTQEYTKADLRLLGLSVADGSPELGDWLHSQIKMKNRETHGKFLRDELMKKDLSLWWVKDQLREAELLWGNISEKDWDVYFLLAPEGRLRDFVHGVYRLRGEDSEDAVDSRKVAWDAARGAWVVFRDPGANELPSIKSF